MSTVAFFILILYFVAGSTTYRDLPQIPLQYLVILIIRIAPTGETLSHFVL
jgi:hypothetical protein